MVLNAILPQFVPRMAHKWDFIGVQLAQAELVSQLRNSPEPDDQKMKQVLDAWIDGVDCFIPISPRDLSEILKSSSVGLHDVANDFDKVGRLHTDCSGLGQRCRKSPGVVKCRASQFPYSCTTLRQVTNEGINTYTYITSWRGC